MSPRHTVLRTLLDRIVITQDDVPTVARDRVTGTLQNLIREGVVEVAGKDPGPRGPRERTYYRLTGRPAYSVEREQRTRSERTEDVATKAIDNRSALERAWGML